VVSWLVGATISAQPATTASSWPQFRGNARLTGTTASQAPAALSPKWTYDAGESIESSAAVADGTVYVGLAESQSVIAVDPSSVNSRSSIADSRTLAGQNAMPTSMIRAGDNGVLAPTVLIGKLLMISQTTVV